MLDFGEAHTLAELLEAAHVAEKKLGEQVWFRGHAKNDWKLVPSAHRRHPALEAQFAHHFRLRAPSLAANCPEHQEYVSWLPLMQHYGLPTRLLDWSESLLVAAFFAIRLEHRSSATIWLLAPGKLNEQSIGLLIPFLADKRVTPLLDAAFSGTGNSGEKPSIATYAPRTDRRMAAQLGNYTIHGSREPLESHPASSNFLARIVIPASSYHKIRADLSVCGVRLSSLFPDLSHLAQEIGEITAFGDDGEDLESRSGLNLL